jgi:branched-subunit amino acid transport protein
MLPETWLPWALIAGMSAIAFLSRALFVVPDRPLTLSPAIERLLRYAPAAALAAIVVPDLVRPDTVVPTAHAWLNPRLLAGVAGIGVAIATRSILLTIVAGMGVLLVVRLLL